MGFPAAEVAAGVRDLLEARGVGAACGQDGGRWLFRAGDVQIVIGPLPEDRRTMTLFEPRCLLALSGEGPLAEALKGAIRIKFLRVTG